MKEYIWKFPDEDLPAVNNMGQSHWCFVCYYRDDIKKFTMNIAFYDKDGKGSKWNEINTLAALPEIICWTTVQSPDLPDSSNISPGSRINLDHES